MTKFFVFTSALLATALLAVPTVSLANQRSFSRDGVTYTYTSTKSGERTIISGKTSDGSAYTLTVRGKRVSGVVGGTPVSFNIDKPLDPAAIETAAR